MLKDKKGQSLIEILIATTIGGIIISSVAGLLVSILRLGSDANKIQASAGLAKELLSEIQNYSQNNWYNIYNLAKDGTSYYLVATGTTFQAVTGTESVAVAKGDISTGLVGDWSFDESTGSYAFDLSGNHNLGTLNYASRLSGSNCVAGGCLSFNGTSSYVNATSSPSLSVTGDLTINAWVYVTSSTARNAVLSKHYNYEYDFLVDGGLHLSFYQGNGSTYTVAATVNNVMQPNNWTMISVTRNIIGGNSLIKFYVNGNFISSSTLTVGPAAGTWPARIGARPDGTTLFNGLIDDVRLYNTALSSTTIKNLYQAQFYNRNFTVSNVNRDSNGYITSGAGTNDPSTQLINVFYSWPSGSTSTVPIYLTRYADQVTYQNDWSGGSGQNGPITIPNNLFSSSTFIDYTSSTGAIIIKGF
jgi:type II secretory pathway pseudopilin PulG